MQSAYRIKNDFQKFLGSKTYSHFITVEVSSRYKFALEDVQRRLGAIEFNLNRAYLKSSFSKWDRDDRFWFVGVREGDPALGNDHFHILLHAPANIYRSSMAWFRMSFPYQFRRSWWEFSPENYRPALHEQYKNTPIWIEPVQNEQRVATYITKTLPRLLDCDNVFFANP